MRKDEFDIMANVITFSRRIELSKINENSKL